MKGKCFIYKRATLHLPNQKAQLFDYTDGMTAYDCEVETSGNHYVYIWRLHDQDIKIPLNITRNMDNGSLVRNGVIPYNDGELRWEFLFGQFKTYPQYYIKLLVSCLPLLLVVLVLCMLFKKMKTNNNRFRY